MALQTTFGMSEDAAASYIQNRTIVQSCSCHNSCAYLGLCCQDKQIVVPEEQRPIVSVLVVWELLSSRFTAEVLFLDSGKRGCLV